MTLVYPIKFPLWLQRVIEELLEEHTWFSDAEKCADLCDIASEELITAIKKVMPEGTNVTPEGDIWHMFVKVDDWFIDLTARQFDSTQNCPKIWQDAQHNTWYHEILKKKLSYFRI